jgi:hypothetical protein
MSADLPLLRAFGALLLLLPLSRAQGTDLFDIPPMRPPRVVDATYFGTHFHRLDRAEHGFPATAWPDGLVGALRLWDSGTRWADLEPAPGRFDFDRLDALVDAARRHGADVSLVLGSAPAWASARPHEAGPYGPGSAAEPRELEDWDRYVEAVARRYQGRIARYELWNEPDFSEIDAPRGDGSAFFTGSAATMVALARHARVAIGREDPAARLLTPGFIGSVQHLEVFLDAGGAPLVDGVAWHFYADDAAGFLRLAADVRRVMARHDLAALPLVDTESGFAIRGVEDQRLAAGEARIDRRRAAALLAQTLVLGAYVGLDRFYQYAWDNGRMGMLRPDGRTATDSLRAWAAVRGWLVGTALEGCEGFGGRGVACTGLRDHERLFIAWQVDAGAAGRFALPAGWHAVSVQQATDATPTRGAKVPASVALSPDGMPVALWARADEGTRK